jgi:hypothetical protein
MFPASSASALAGAPKAWGGSGGKMKLEMELQTEPGLRELYAQEKNKKEKLDAVIKGVVREDRQHEEFFLQSREKVK